MKRSPSEWLERFGWAAGGFAACFTLITQVVMGPSDLLRWVQRNDTVEERLRHVFEPDVALAAAAAKIAEVQKDLFQCRETMSATSNFAPATLPKSPERPNCITDLQGVRAVRINSEETKGFLGGRLYVTVNSVVDGCMMTVTTDRKTASPSIYYSSGGSYNPNIKGYPLGSATEFATSLGTFRIIVVGEQGGLFRENFCVIDLMPTTKKSNDDSINADYKN